MSLPTSKPLHKIFVPLFALYLVLGFAILYLTHDGLYATIIRSWGGFNPYRFPFIDLHYVLASIQCWNHGMDVYIQNVCDIEHRLFNYSPLWLRATFLPGTEWTNLLGLALVVSFLLSLFYLISPRGLRELLLFLLATTSPMLVFAVERANVDLVMFLFCLGAGVILTKQLPQRLLGYLVILLAGLLKFYPLPLLMLVVRERLLIGIGVMIVTLATLIMFLAEYHYELLEMAPNIPAGSYFYGVFGARDLPYGLKEVLSSYMQVKYYDPDAVFAVAIIAASGYALHIACRGYIRQAVNVLPQRQRTFLMIGAILIIGCFLAGQNIAYRGIYFLFVLPGLLVLSREGGGQPNPGIFFVASIVVILLMWEELLRKVARAVARTISTSWEIPDITFWLCGELLWWWLIGFLGGLVIIYIWMSNTLLDLRLVVTYSLSVITATFRRNLRQR